MEGGARGRAAGDLRGRAAQPGEEGEGGVARSDNDADNGTSTSV